MEKQRVRIKEHSWLARIAARTLASARVAVVVGHTIHLHNTTKGYFLSKPRWVRHELKHVAQYEAMGLLGFLWSYLLESIRHGYYDNRLEAEARAAEHDDALLAQYQID